MSDPFRAVLYRCPDLDCDWWSERMPDYHWYGQCPAERHKQEIPADGLRLGRDCRPIVVIAHVVETESPFAEAAASAPLRSDSEAQRKEPS